VEEQVQILRLRSAVKIFQGIAGYGAFRKLTEPVVGQTPLIREHFQSERFPTSDSPSTNRLRAVGQTVECAAQKVRLDLTSDAQAMRKIAELVMDSMGSGSGKDRRRKIRPNGRIGR
jgi:hypothetical protein